jgi:hypothetical protein
MICLTCGREIDRFELYHSTGRCTICHNASQLPNTRKWKNKNIYRISKYSRDYHRANYTPVEIDRRFTDTNCRDELDGI